MRKISYFLSLLIVLSFGFTLFSLGGRQDNIQRLSNEQFSKQAALANHIIIDVRKPDEYKTGHIKGAINLDYLETNSFKKQILSLDPSKYYLLYCRTGVRSLNAAKVLKEKGFVNVSDLKNGISEWTGPIVSGEKE